MRRTLSAVVAAALAALALPLSSCGVPGTSAVEPRAPGPAGPNAATVGVVDAGGQRQFLDCEGSGGPTFVLVAGLWGWSKDWAAELPVWRADGRVCVYDRPGLGSSPGRVGTLAVDAGVHARELRDVLAAAGESGPYVVVGHSYGGLVARAFVSAYPGEVSGLALLDAMPAGFEALSPSYGTVREEASPRTTIDLVASSRAVGSLAPLAHLPLLVLTAGIAPSQFDAETARLLVIEQDRVAAASDDSLRLTAEGATHQLQDTAPQLVAPAVTELRDAVRESRPVAPCSDRWRALGASCRP